MCYIYINYYTRLQLYRERKNERDRKGERERERGIILVFLKNNKLYNIWSILILKFPHFRNTMIIITYYNYIDKETGRERESEETSLSLSLSPKINEL